MINETANFSKIGYLDFNSTLAQNSEIQIGTLLKDFCIQIDQKIFLCANIIFLFYVLSKIILPNLSNIMFKKLSPSEYIKYTYYSKKVEDYLDTGAVISVLFIIAIGGYQYGWNRLNFAIMVLGTAFIIKVAEWRTK